MTSKKSIFIFIGVFIVAVAFFLSKTSLVEATKKEGKKFDDWTVACTPKDKNGKTPQQCFLTQAVNIQQDDKQQMLAMYQIGYFGEKNELKMVQTLPLGVSIEAGTSITSSKNFIAPGKYTTCTQQGCNAVAPISDEDLKKLISMKDTAVAFMSIDGQQINIPLSTKGLEKGLAYLKK